MLENVSVFSCTKRSNIYNEIGSDLLNKEIPSNTSHTYKYLCRNFIFCVHFGGYLGLRADGNPGIVAGVVAAEGEASRGPRRAGRGQASARGGGNCDAEVATP